VGKNGWPPWFHSKDFSDESFFNFSLSNYIRGKLIIFREN
jgi:hypothetical protein